MSGLRVVLFGSGSPISTAAFDAVRRSARLEAVVVPGPRRSLRNLRVRWPLVRRALASGVPILWHGSGEARAIGEIARLAPDLLCVATFPSLLGRELLELPRSGAIGIHPALLPRHRGPSPLFWTYFCGDAETGPTVYWLDAGMDTGPILSQKAIPVPRGLPAAELYARLAAEGAGLLGRALVDAGRGAASRVPQEQARASCEGHPGRDTSWRAALRGWGAEQLWHFLSGLTGRAGELLSDGAGRPVLHGRPRGFVRTPHGREPGKLEAAPHGWRAYCFDGWVDVEGAPAAARLRRALAAWIR